VIDNNNNPEQCNVPDGLRSNDLSNRNLTLYQLCLVEGTSIEGKWSAHTLFKITLNNITFVDMYPHVKYFDCVLPLLYMCSSFKINFCDFFFFLL
jgi:hypothetical protein